MMLTGALLMACATTETNPEANEDPLKDWKKCVSIHAVDYRSGDKESAIELQREEIWLRCLKDLDEGYEGDALKLLHQQAEVKN